jgi:hypothetical protein
MEHMIDEMEWIAEEIQSTAVEARRITQEGASRMEALFRSASAYDTNIDSMSTKYQWKENTALMWTSNEGEAGYIVVGATGIVPVDDAIKRELRLYEYMLPFFREGYIKNKYCDELMYLDKRSMVAGHVTLDFKDMFPPGFDAETLCASGITYYDYYAWVDAKLNPQRISRWAPSPFIDLAGCFIQCCHSPVYKRKDDSEMSGFVGVHYNLNLVNEATVHKSENRIVVVTGGATLIGASPAALQAIHMAPYVKQKPSWQAPQEVRNYIDKEQNLEQGKPEDLAELSRKIRTSERFEHTLFGTKFSVIRKTVPELDFYVAALC